MSGAVGSALEGTVLKQDADTGRWVAQPTARPGYSVTDRRRAADPLGLDPFQRATSDMYALLEGRRG
jgi:hypothetical protein